MSKKIIIFSNTSWSIYNFRLSLACFLREKGYHVSFLAPKDKYTKFLKKEGFQVFHLSLNSKSINPFIEFKTLRRIYKIYRKEKPDIVLHFTPKPNIYGSLVARRLHIKVINNITGLGRLVFFSPFTKYFIKKLYRYSQKSVHTVFFQNKNDLETLKKLHIVSGKSVLIPGSGVDLEKFRFMPKTYENSNTHFLFIGRLLILKGIQLYLDAAKKVKEKYGDTVIFSILGYHNPKEKDYIKKEILDEYITKKFVFYKGVSKDVFSHLAHTDCVVLPSFYPEGTPRSLIEAQAVGRAVITSESIGCKEAVLHEKTGYLCKPHSLEELYNKIEHFIKMPPSKKQEFQKNARHFAEKKFDENIIKRAYTDALKME